MWLRKIVDLRRWIEANSATSRARAVRPRIRRVPPTSGRARKRVKRVGKVAWRAIVASRNSSSRRRTPADVGEDNPESAAGGTPDPERMMGTDNLP